jgi:hypothetical protein
VNSPFPILAVEFQELDWRRFLDLQAEAAGNLTQGVIEVRMVVDGHVAHEGAADFIVAHAAMQPTKKEETLHARGKTDDDPIGIHRFVL